MAWRGKGSGGGPRASVPGGVGGRGTGPRDGANFATCRFFVVSVFQKKKNGVFLKDALWGWGGVPTELAWWTGGRPRALVAGERWGPSCGTAKQANSPGLGVREGLAWRGKGSGGGPRASVPGGVGGRGTGPRDGANFATCVVFLSFLTRTKRRKMAFLKGALWGGGGYPPELAWWTGRPRALVAGEGWGGA